MKILSLIINFVILGRLNGFAGKGELFDVNNSPKLNIVVHSTFGGRSHIKAVLEIGNELVNRGHRVTYVSLEENIRFSKGYNIGNYSLGKGFLDDTKMRNIMKKRILNKSTENTFKIMRNTLGPILSKNYEDTFEPLKEYLVETKPDLLVCDLITHPCIDLAKHLGIPLIKGYQTTDGTGLTMEPFIIMEQKYSPIYTKDMSFIERFYFQVIKQATSLYYLYQITHMENKIRKKYGIPPTYGMHAGLDYGLSIANTFPGFEPAIAMVPSVVQLGPFISESKEKLTPELDEFLKHHENTLFTAFGSNAVLNDDLLKRILEGLLLALEEGIIDGVIWGLGRTKQIDFPPEVNDSKGSKIKVQELFEGKNTKIKLLSWAPQVSILDHNNTKLFLSHGGLESTFEAIHSGTSVLCLALFADQARNARKIEEIGAGLYVAKFTFTPKSLKEQFKIVIEDKDDKFKSNLLRMRTISHHNSRRLNYAADLFEQHAYTAKACRKHEPYNSKLNLPPCEIKHLIPVSDQMSYIKAKGIDIYGIATLLVLLSFISSLYSLYYLLKLVYKFYKQLTTN